jgi:glycine cleavage system transcriptional repressor
LSTSHSHFLLTAFGPDRAGMVAALTQPVFELGGNVLDASMSRLGGEFSMMMVLSFPSDESIPAFEKKFKSITFLQTNLKPISAQDAVGTTQTEPSHLIAVYGADRPGLVYQVTQACAAHYINISDLYTRRNQSTPPLYVMYLEVSIPVNEKISVFEKELKELAGKLQVDISIRDVESASL